MSQFDDRKKAAENKFSIDKELEFKFLKIIPLVMVSGKPPLLDIITAHPLLAASKLVLPKGSSHLEQAMAILVLSKLFKTLLWL